MSEGRVPVCYSSLTGAPRCLSSPYEGPPRSLSLLIDVPPESVLRKMQEGLGASLSSRKAASLPSQ